MSSSEPTPTAKKANLFDLRRIIGGLFIVYGLLLTILGLFDSQKEIDKAAGVHINLWAGLGMLVVGGGFGGAVLALLGPGVVRPDGALVVDPGPPAALV